MTDEEHQQNLKELTKEQLKFFRAENAKRIREAQERAKALTEKLRR